MSVDGYFRIFIGLFALVLLGSLVFDVRRGRLRAGDRLYERDTQPGAFWFETAMQLLVPLILCACLLVIPPQGPGDLSPPYGAFFILAMCAPLAIRSIWTGTVHGVLSREGFSRRDRPGPYWVILMGCIALCVAIVLLLVFNPRF